MSTNRQILPPRRASETITVIHWNQTFTLTVGFFDDGTLGRNLHRRRKSGADLPPSHKMPRW